MTKQTINRLGVLSYSVLALGVFNGLIHNLVKPAMDQASLPVLVPLCAVNFLGGAAGLYCFFSFVNHLYTENRRLTGVGKAAWVILLLAGNLVAMPVYWHLFVARETSEEKALVKAAPADEPGRPTNGR